MAVLKIFFHYADRKPELPDKKSIRYFIQKIFRYEKIKIKEIDYIFCSDDFLLKINQEFLNHSFYTDIITFSLNDGEQSIDGEVYISIDRVKENCKFFKTSFRDELLRVLFHGALHLCGYNDVTSSEINEMRHKEEHYLQMFHVKHSKI